MSDSNDRERDAICPEMLSESTRRFPITERNSEIIRQGDAMFQAWLESGSELAIDDWLAENAPQLAYAMRIEKAGTEDQASIYKIGRPPRERLQTRPSWAVIIVLGLMVMVSLIYLPFSSSQASTFQIHQSTPPLDITHQPREAQFLPERIAANAAGEPIRNGPPIAFTLAVSNPTFPVKIYVDGRESDENIRFVDPQDGEKQNGRMASPLKIEVQPNSAGEFLQNVTVVKNGRSLWTSAGTFYVPIDNGDQITLFLEAPTHPWNATIFMVKGRKALLTLDRPWAMFDQTSHNGEPQNNSMLCWAEAGTEGMARELAQYFIENRGSEIRYRGRRHASLTVPTIGGQSTSPIEISAPFADIAEEELYQALYAAFKSLENAKSPTGVSVGAELRKAKAMLMRN